jgi:hypothetical protein
VTAAPDRPREDNKPRSIAAASGGILQHAAKGYVPPNGKHWVDHIRKKGNEATHEVSLMSESDSKELIVFVEMLLKFVYEFPSIVPRPPE